MPVTTGRKAIRFKSIGSMLNAIERDDEYQHRHLIIQHLCDGQVFCTRKEVAHYQGIPINAISKAVSALVAEGVVHEYPKDRCKITGRLSGIITLNTQHQGPY